MLFVAEGSSEESLDAFWAALTEEQKAGAQAMEMWDPYVNSTRRHLPEADGKIVFDKFHIAQNNRSKSACTFDLA